MRDFLSVSTLDLLRAMIARDVGGHLSLARDSHWSSVSAMCVACNANSRRSSLSAMCVAWTAQRHK